MFIFVLGQKVKMKNTEEFGEVIGRSDYLNSDNRYWVSYVAGGGRQADDWFYESQIVAVPS